MFTYVLNFILSLPFWFLNSLELWTERKRHSQPTWIPWPSILAVEIETKIHITKKKLVNSSSWNSRPCNPTRHRNEPNTLLTVFLPHNFIKMSFFFFYSSYHTDQKCYSPTYHTIKFQSMFILVSNPRKHWHTNYNRYNAKTITSRICVLDDLPNDEKRRDGEVERRRWCRCCCEDGGGSDGFKTFNPNKSQNSSNTLDLPSP